MKAEERLTISAYSRIMQYGSASLHMPSRRVMFGWLSLANISHSRRKSDCPCSSLVCRLFTRTAISSSSAPLFTLARSTSPNSPLPEEEHKHTCYTRTLVGVALSQNFMAHLLHFFFQQERVSGNTQSCYCVQAGAGELQLVVSAVAFVVPSRRHGVQRHILLNLGCGLAILLHCASCRRNQETYDYRRHVIQSNAYVSLVQGPDLLSRANRTGEASSGSDLQTLRAFMKADIHFHNYQGLPRAKRA